MKIIVTGAIGFVGRNLAEHFHEEGASVVATGRSRGVGEELRRQGIQFEAADILEKDRLVRAFSKADCVIHCAALAGPWGRYRDFFETNVLGTRNVVRACRYHGIEKIIFISTPSIYYNGKHRYDISEDDPLPGKQVSNYAKTKRKSEIELLALEHEGFKTIIFRPRAIMGPHDNTFVPRILRMAGNGKIPLINGGKAMVDITHIGDFSACVGKALAAPDPAWNHIYNISNGDPISVKEWFARILAAFDKPFISKDIPESVAKLVAGCMEVFSYLPFVDKEPPLTRFSVGYMARSMTMRIDKAKERLGYEPKIDNREGFEQLAQGVG